jgi:hypothetical protein
MQMGRNSHEIKRADVGPPVSQLRMSHTRRSG